MLVCGTGRRRHLRAIATGGSKRALHQQRDGQQSDCTATRTFAGHLPLPHGTSAPWLGLGLRVTGSLFRVTVWVMVARSPAFRHGNLATQGQGGRCAGGCRRPTLDSGGRTPVGRAALRVDYTSSVTLDRKKIACRSH